MQKLVALSSPAIICHVSNYFHTASPPVGNHRVFEVVLSFVSRRRKGGGVHKGENTMIAKDDQKTEESDLKI